MPLTKLQILRARFLWALLERELTFGEVCDPLSTMYSAPNRGETRRPSAAFELARTAYTMELEKLDDTARYEELDVVICFLFEVHTAQLTEAASQYRLHQAVT